MTKTPLPEGAPASAALRPLTAGAALLACGALVAPSLALAQAAEDGAAVALEPITVESAPVDDDARSIVANRATTGSKTDTDLLDTPGSVSVITAKEIETRGAKTLEQALAYTPGVFVNEWGGDDRYDAFRIRGFDQLSLGTYRDGLPVRGFGWTFGRREPYGFERVEVLKGSNSALFGLNAPGGLVNAVTKKPKSEQFGEAYATGGVDHAEFGSDFGGPIDEGGLWSYRLTGKWQDSVYSYDYSDDDRVFLAGGLTFRPSDATELTLLADFNKRDGVPGTGYLPGSGLDIDTFLGEPDFNEFNTDEKSVGLQFSHKLGGGLAFRSNARYTTLDLTYEQVYGASFDPMANRESFAVYSDSQQFAIDNQLQYDASFGDFDSRTLLGVEYGWIKVDEEVYYGIADGVDIHDIQYCGRSCVTLFDYLDWIPQQDTKSVYLQEELTISDRLIATIGGRYDYIDVEIEDQAVGATLKRDFESFTKRLGLTYKLNDGLSVYGNYSESFEPDIWNPTLDPTEGEQYEVGVKYRPEGMNALFTFAAFDLTQTNVSNQVSPTEFRQVGEINVKGLEFEAKMALADQLNLTAAYSFWDAEITENGIEGNEGNRPARVPEHLASLWADYTLKNLDPVGDMTFGVGVRYVGETFGDDANTLTIDDYTLVDAAFGYAITENVGLSLNALNLFDEEYVTTNYFGTEYYGEGRTVTATLKYRW